MKYQVISDKNGAPAYVLVPFNAFEALTGTGVTKAVSERSATIPHEVVRIKYENHLSLLAAWRIYRGFCQKEVAIILGVTQAAVAGWETSVRPRKTTREKLAVLYRCNPACLF